MSKAIKITAKKAPKDYDLGASKFFGTPTVPPAWNGDFYDDELFFCQIRLSDRKTNCPTRDISMFSCTPTTENTISAQTCGITTASPSLPSTISTPPWKNMRNTPKHT